MRATDSLSLFVSAIAGIVVVPTAQVLASSPEAQHAVRAAAPACQADCAQPCEQLTRQVISWTQASFATKITAATVLEIYNNVVGATRTIIQYNTAAADFTTVTSNGVENTYVGGYTVTTAPDNPQQTSKTTTYVDTTAGTPSTVTVTFGTVLSILSNTISWSGTVPTTVQGTPTCLVHSGFDVETLSSMITVTSVLPAASDSSYLGMEDDPYGVFWSPVYNSNVPDGEDQTYLAQFFPDVAALSVNTCPVVPGCNLPRPRAARLANRQVPGQGATSSGTAIVLTTTSSLTETAVATTVVPAQSQFSGNSSVTSVASATTSASSTSVSTSTSSVTSGTTSSPSSSPASATSVSSSSISSSPSSVSSQTLVVGQPLPVVFSTVTGPSLPLSSPSSSVVLVSSTTTQSAVSAISLPGGGSSTISVSASTTISAQVPPPQSVTAAAGSSVTTAPLLSVSPSLLYNGSTATFALTQSSVIVAPPSSSVSAPGNVTYTYANTTVTGYRNATGTAGVITYTGNAAPAAFEAGHGVVTDSLFALIGSMLGMWLW